MYLTFGEGKIFLVTAQAGTNRGAVTPSSGCANSLRKPNWKLPGFERGT